MAWISFKQSNYDQSLSEFSQALSTMRSTNIDDPYLELSCLKNMGEICRKIGIYDDAQMHFDEALQIAKSFNDYEQTGIYFNKAYAYKSQRDYNKALDFFTLTFKRSLDSGDSADHVRAVKCLINLGYISTELKHYADARGYYDQIGELSKLKPSYYRRKLCQVKHNYARSYFMEGNYDLAEKYYMEALELKAAHDPNNLFITYKDLGELYIRQDKLDLAGTFLSRAETLFDSEQLDYESIEVYSLLKKLHNGKDWDRFNSYDSLHMAYSNRLAEMKENIAQENNAHHYYNFKYTSESLMARNKEYDQLVAWFEKLLPLIATCIFVVITLAFVQWQYRKSRKSVKNEVMKTISQVNQEVEQADL